eukprot:266298_1
MVQFHSYWLWKYCVFIGLCSLTVISVSSSVAINDNNNFNVISNDYFDYLYDDIDNNYYDSDEYYTDLYELYDYVYEVINDYLESAYNLNELFWDYLIEKPTALPTKSTSIKNIGPKTTEIDSMFIPMQKLVTLSVWNSYEKILEDNDIDDFKEIISEGVGKIAPLLVPAVIKNTGKKKVAAKTLATQHAKLIVDLAKKLQK